MIYWIVNWRTYMQILYMLPCIRVVKVLSKTWLLVSDWSMWKPFFFFYQCQRSLSKTLIWIDPQYHHSKKKGKSVSCKIPCSLLLAWTGKEPFLHFSPLKPRRFLAPAPQRPVSVWIILQGITVRQLRAPASVTWEWSVSTDCTRG